jgi:signal transduction histidine kinase
VTTKPGHNMLTGRRVYLQRWFLGALIGLVAALIRASLQPVLGNELPFAFAFPAVAVASVFWGVGAGLATSVVCLLVAANPDIPPFLNPSLLFTQVSVFIGCSVVVAICCGLLAKRQAPGTATRPDDPFETPLTNWLRAVIWSALLIPLCAFLAASWWAYDRAEQEARAAVAHGADLALQHAQRTFRIAAEVARRADEASSGGPREAESRQAQVHQRLKDMATGVPGVQILSVWDQDGSLLARSDSFPVSAGVNISDRAYFKEQQRAPDVVGVSPSMKGRLTGAELINTTVRRRSADGSFQGLVAASLAPAFFSDYYRSLSKEQPTLASFALMRNDGEVLARWPEEAGDTRQIDAESPVLSEIPAGANTGIVVLPKTASREARMASFARLKGFPLYVVAGVSRDAMFAGWIRFEALLAGILFPTALGLSYVSWVALKKTRRESATALALQEQIGRRAAAERSLLEAQKYETIGLVTAGVAHDFNNLLAILGASMHTLKRQYPVVANTKQLDAMTRAMASGVRLTRQLLSFTRKQALKPETISLQSWLPGTENLVRSTVGSSITWALKIDADTRPVTVDTAELELAIINLVLNAKHAMPSGGLLTVHASNADTSHGFSAPMVLICVKDSGIGIPPEVLPRVFEPFFTTRTKGSGSGLGLGQVQGFCAQAAGEVRIESVVAKGTTVCIFLPAASTALSVAEPAPLDESLSGSVLLVDDNDEVSSTTARLLRGAGLSVTQSPSADAALLHLQRAGVPDVVLSDIAMPGTDGITFALLLRDRYPALPVLLTTGYADKLDEAIASGLRVLPKPVSPADMLAELKAATTRGLLPATS